MNWRYRLAFGMAAVMAWGSYAIPAQAQPTPPPGAAQAAETPPEPQIADGTVDPEKRNEIIGAGWQRSGDRMWTTASDATGFHLLVAEANTGYTWRTAASLAQPGVEADQWIGNACVTGSGRRAVVVYAPRTYTNKTELFARGGYTAVVDLVTGVVTKLGVRTTLAYYNPGCGTGEKAVLTQGGGDELKKTRVLTLNASTAKIGRKVEVPGQLTSAMPVGDEIVAADAGAVVRVRNNGSRVVLSDSGGVPFNLRPDADGGVVFMDQAKEKLQVRRVKRTDKSLSATGTAPVLAKGATGRLGVASSATGRIFITGEPEQVATLPPIVTEIDVPSDASVSTRGESSVTDVQTAEPSGTFTQLVGAEAPVPVNIESKSLRTGKVMEFGVDPGDTMAPRAEPYDPAHTCAVRRNDPNIQVYQPKPKQVEWAANMAVKGQLMITRPANWKNNGQSAYQPQVLFPPQPLVTGGQVPAQVMLGILGQESNLWQASRLILPGETGNPLIGNYYGTQIYDNDTSNDWDIRFDHADCGYGVSQMTDGMRKAGSERPHEIALPYKQQVAIATDYAANVAAGLDLLKAKWNQMQYLNIKANNNDPSKIENWFFAVWAYNAGYHAPGEPDTNGAYGLGWAQNPANPNYYPGRALFGTDPHDFARPQDWPYPEKVLGFAANPPSVLEAPDTYVPMFRPAWWTSTGWRANAAPLPQRFCVLENNCEWGMQHVPNYPGNGSAGSDVRGEPAGPCAHKSTSGQYDLKCWWHSSMTWKTDCSTQCGNEFIRYDYPEYAAEPLDGESYRPSCTSTPISGVNLLVVDDIPASVPTVSVPGCARPASAGTFDMEFGTDSSGRESSKIDLHQVGGGLGGHFWWGHSRDNEYKMRITGTWNFSAAYSGWGRLMVHLPDHHAHTQQAAYQIDTGTGTFAHTRYINQKRRANNWVSLGVYQFTGKPRVKLATDTKDGTGEEDVAFDAVGLQKLPAKPKHIVAVLGDSYTSGEGVGNYYRESDIAHGTSGWNACRRSKDAWGRQLVLPGMTQSVGAKADAWANDLELGFVACSGARTFNVYDSSAEQDYREGQFGEENQVTSGVLTGDTTLVMLSIGGNDQAGFTRAMEDCALLDDCSLDPDFLPKYKAIIDTMTGKVDTVVYEIRRKASKAQIVLMGYPELLSRTVKCNGSLYWDGGEADALAQLVNYANAKQKALADNLRASGAKVDFADPVPAFVGHGGCDNPEWINKIVEGPLGDGDFHPGDPATRGCAWEWIGFCLSRASFHPNQGGATGYAGVMRAKLDQIGYNGA
ncbi:MAG TPA: SGNH/GDSL hydrolase family protein [Actinoplanes sp.]|nr:SGNH/GDSL hydrolase family protein [Actinoplanes sp.]